MEQWKPIQGFDLYEVSSLGRVRSWRKRGCIRGQRLDLPLIKKLRTDKAGYQRVTLRAGRTKELLVHALMLEAFVGKRPAGYDTRHLNGNPADNRLCNLKWGTRQQNVDDAMKHGTVPRGEGHWNSRLTEAQARYALNSTGPCAIIARELGVHEGTVSRIRTGKRWPHLQPTLS